MDTLKLYGIPGLLVGTWAVIAAGTMATLAKLPVPDGMIQEAPIEQRQESPDTAPYVSSSDRVVLRDSV